MKRVLIAVILLAVAASAGYYLFRPEEDHGFLGWVEADALYIGAPDTARLTVLTVEEGDEAQTGQRLFALEADVEQAAVDTARANLEKARAALALARAPQDRPEQLEALQASRKEAEAALEYAEKSLTRARSLFRQESGTKANLDSAVSAYAQAKAALDKINAQIALGELPQRDQQIEQAEQSVSAAGSDLAAAEAALALKTVSAPASGSIEEVYYRTGEVVPAGRPVVALLPPQNIKIEFFVPERERAALKVGDRVRVSCDGCRPQDATIFFIAKDAEYTPPEIFSREERAKMVYRLEARPEDPAALAVGLPVNVTRERD
ncbi:HlyD family efflux transporter periplasmic adaptor subunit [Martelella lutilitoris]|uniref:HlyD family efflux transporter periplasmic adaptor subunit n=1 Tax=Martelella lutilitoris TaxID=2583532 RepID=A0A7T7KKI3_9HYPH|nr:HlyD family efflux transporter periplasmic adaptor subunit [Martelella lutilitoris]QQM29553.1 HlyD family efflux transporter periplasmic adaptor subunit [Martelella lutilitoris]